MPPVRILRKLAELLARDDIFKFLEPVNKLCCLAGLYFPFGGRSQLHFLVLSLSVLCSFFYWGATKFSDLSQLGIYELFYIFQVVSVSFSLLYQNLRRREMARALRKIREADYYLAAFGMNFRYSLSFLLWVVPSLGALVVFDAFLSPAEWPPAEMAYFCGLLSCQVYLLALRPRLALAALATHFRHIAHRLRYLSGTPDTRGREVKIKVLVRVFGLLADAAQLQNQRSLHIAAIVFHAFFSIVIKLFYVYSQFRKYYMPLNSDFFTDLRSISYNLGFIFVWVRIISGLVNPSVQCKEQAESFSSILFDLVYDGTSRQLMNSEDLNLFLMARREVLLTASGIFPLDNTLYYSMMTSACSYLLFTIQLF